MRGCEGLGFIWPAFYDYVGGIGGCTPWAMQIQCKRGSLDAESRSGHIASW